MTWKNEPPPIKEDALQRNCITWFRWRYQTLALRLWAIPNGGMRNATVAAKLKATGVLAGVCDLFLSVPRGGYGGMFIEMKVGNNALSDNQEKFIKAHEKDYYCCICYTLEEFIKEVEKYLK